MNQQISQETLKKILQAVDIDELSYEEIESAFLEEESIKDYIPDGICQVDPRNGDRIVYNTARAHRPHDNVPVDEIEEPAFSNQDCAICSGKTTGVLDYAELSEGFTFINKNLYPIHYPTDGSERYPTDYGKQSPKPDGIPTHGLHFLQWTSSFHDRDWHNMPLADRVIVLERLGALERKLLTGSEHKMPPTKSIGGQTEKRGYVSIIKNQGRLVGGSLVHGHQQIGFSNVMPGKFRRHWLFSKQRGENFASYLLRLNPDHLTIQDYGPAVLLVPYFMRRPYEMYLVLKDTSKQYLHELNEGELSAVADGWHDAILAILRVMPKIGRETAYIVTAINGPGAGLYFEFLPYTQETGGMEHLGLYLCQGNPDLSASHIRQILDVDPEEEMGVDSLESAT